MKVINTPMETHDLVESHTTVQMPFILDTWIRLSNVILLGRYRAQISARIPGILTYFVHVFLSSSTKIQNKN